MGAISSILEGVSEATAKITEYPTPQQDQPTSSQLAGEAMQRAISPPSYPQWGVEEQALTVTPTLTPAQEIAEDTGINVVLERLGLDPVTPVGTLTFAPAPMTEEQVITQFTPVLERLGMPVLEPTIEGIEGAIGKRYEAPIHEGVPQLGGMQVEFPDVIGGLKDAGKWILYGGLALAGLWLAGKYMGRKQ